MTIIIGLGNPGEQYKNTRHNVGFMAIDEFARKNNFPEFKLSRLDRGSSMKSEQKKSNALVSEHIIGNEDVILVKPQTFMNESGKSVKSLTKPYPLNAKPLIVVVHDDIDLPLGKIKVSENRNSAGHKGVESIIKSIGNNGLIRFRIGIAPQKDVKAERVVLKNFSEDEQKMIDQVLQKIADALNLFVKEGLDRAMNEYNS